MKWILLASLAVMAPAMAEEAPQTLDLKLFNAAVAKIVKGVLESHKAGPNPMFTALELKIDERRTDLSSNDYIKLGVTARATATRAIWAPNGDTTVQLDLGATADRLKNEAEFSAGLRLETDVVGLGRYAVAEMAKSTCDTKRKNLHSEDIVKRACEITKGLEKAADIAALFNGLQQLGDLAVAYQTAEVAYQEAALAKEPDPKKKKSIQYSVDRAKREFQLTVQIAAALTTTNNTGKATGQYRFDMKALAIPEYGELKDLEVYIDKNQVQINVRFLTKNVKNMDSYFKNKPEIEKALVKLQNEDPESTKAVQDIAGFYLEIVKQFLGDKR